MGGGRHEFAVPKPSFNRLEFLKLAATCPPSLPSESLPSVSNSVVVERDLPDRRINVRLNIAFAAKKKDPRLMTVCATGWDEIFVEWDGREAVGEEGETGERWMTWLDLVRVLYLGHELVIVSSDRTEDA